MAVNSSRRLNAELHEGSTEGSYWKPDPDRGGEVDYLTIEQRYELHPEWYGGLAESSVKRNPTEM